MDTIARIRREFFTRGRAIKDIVRDLHVSRNTVRKVIRSGATAFAYEREVQPLPKLGPWRDDLDRMLTTNTGKFARERLTLIRIYEALRDLDPRPIRKALSVVGERMIHELRGLSCLPLELVPAQRKGCAVTRSFSNRITERAVLEEAVSAHATRLGEKLRRDGLGTDQVTVFYHTSEHDRGDPMRSVSTVVSLPEATNDTLTLIKAACLGVAKTWRDQGHLPWRYSKAGIVTTDLLPLEASTRALIGQLDRERSAPLMAALDACNTRFGRGSVVPARAGLTAKRNWATKFEMRTPRYTTSLNEIPYLHASAVTSTEWHPRN